MAKDIVIHVWCDRHMETDERVEGTEQPVTLNGKALTIDLCEACTKEFVTPLAQLLDAHGVPALSAVKARMGAPRRLGDGTGAPCVWCDLDFSSSNSSGYMRHIKIIHGYASAIEAFGTDCPICGDGGHRMMMTHIKKRHPEHGFTHTAQAIQWAKGHGDPHGVYAATLNRKPSLVAEPTKGRTKTR